VSPTKIHTRTGEEKACPAGPKINPRDRSMLEEPGSLFNNPCCVLEGREVVMEADPAPTMEEGGIVTLEAPRAATRWAVMAVIC